MRPPIALERRHGPIVKHRRVAAEKAALKMVPCWVRGIQRRGRLKENWVRSVKTDFAV